MSYIRHISSFVNANKVKLSVLISTPLPFPVYELWFPEQHPVCLTFRWQTNSGKVEFSFSQLRSCERFSTLPSETWSSCVEPMMSHDDLFMSKSSILSLRRFEPITIWQSSDPDVKLVSHTVLICKRLYTYMSPLLLMTNFGLSISFGDSILNCFRKI